MAINFDDLDVNPVTSSTKGGIDLNRVHIANGGEATSQLIDCPKCSGRGYIVIGYTYTRNAPCFRCQNSPVKGKITVRSLAASKARVTRETNVAERFVAFQRDNAAVVAFLSKNAEWSDFYRSLNEALVAYGSLTENQLAAVKRGIEKAAAKKAERIVSAPVVDVSAIEALFATAQSNGLKRPVFRAEGLEISLASASSRNAGALYVKAGGEYQGKVQSGRFHAVRACLPTTNSRLLEVAADPLGQAKLYGQQTGSCSCCGRELTDPVSIANGIGPICQVKWGL